MERMRGVEGGSAHNPPPPSKGRRHSPFFPPIFLTWRGLEKTMAVEELIQACGCGLALPFFFLFCIATSRGENRDIVSVNPVPFFPFSPFFFSSNLKHYARVVGTVGVLGPLSSPLFLSGVPISKR